jgi:hypothetical protein
MADTRDNYVPTAGGADDYNALAIAAGYIYGNVSGGATYPLNPFESQAYTEQVDGENLKELYLSHWPITAVSSIKDSQGTNLGLIVGTVPTGSTTANVWIVDSIQDGEYHGYILNPNGEWTKGRKNYIVAYTAGFDSATFVPANLKTAIALIKADLVARQSAPDLKSVSVDGAAYTFVESMGLSIPTKAVALLNGFRRFRA